MPNTMQIDELISLENNIKNRINSIFAFNSELLRNPNTVRNFQQGLSKLEMLKNIPGEIPEKIWTLLLSELQSCSNKIDDLTANHITANRLDSEGVNKTTALVSNLNSLLISVLQQIQRLKEEEQTNKNEILTAQLESAIQNIRSERKGLTSELDKLKNKSADDAKTISGLKQKLESDLKEFDERYKTRFGNFEMFAQALTFNDESRSNSKEANNYLYFIAGLTLLLLGLSIWFMFGCWIDFECLKDKWAVASLSKTTSWQILFYYELFRPVLIRVFILSIIATLLKIAIQNYNASMHNKTINMHKANSLAAMLRIINSLNNDDARSNLINLAGKEIFTHQKTGYLRKDEAKIDLGIIEKLASILKKKE